MKIQKRIGKDLALRAKGTLISEPRFLPLETCDFSHAIKGKMALFEGFSLKMAFSLYRIGESHVAGGSKSGLTN